MARLLLGLLTTGATEEVWCTVPNYRFYRWTVHKSRGFSDGTSDCSAAGPLGDGCACADETNCLSGYCVSGLCSTVVFQVAELEFWRQNQLVRTRKAEDLFDAWRVVNMVDVVQTWGVSELEFYSDTSCSNITNGTAIFSSNMSHGFGHSVDHTAPMGLQDTARTYWQSRPFAEPATFELHGPATFAFDSNTTTNWWANCRPCPKESEWLGLEFPTATQVKCVRILQDKDHDYASFSLALEGRNGSGWARVTTFNAATYDYGGVWEQLPVPQGVAFASGHARLLDGNLNSSLLELVNSSLEFDFGVETELDAFRWATALEPSDCAKDGPCPWDPVQWTLEGSLDRVNWVTLHAQNADFHTPIYRKSFVELQRLHHKVLLNISEVWPDGRGRCAARR